MNASGLVDVATHVWHEQYKSSRSLKRKTMKDGAGQALSVRAVRLLFLRSCHVGS